MNKIKNYWERGTKEKIIVSVIAGVLFFVLYKIFRGIFKPKTTVNNVALTSDNPNPSIKSSGLVYGTVGTNTDVGYLNDSKFENIDSEFKVLSTDLSDLFNLQQTTVENISRENEEINEKIQSLQTMQTDSYNPLERLYKYADEITKYKEEYMNADTVEKKQQASAKASRTRSLAYNFAKQNGLNIDETYYNNELLSGGGYTEYTIEGITI